MVSVAFQLIEELTAHVQSYSLEDAREICADGTNFPNILRRKGVFINNMKSEITLWKILCFNR